jgi:hypothetical protein
MNGAGGRYLPAAYTQMTNPQLRMNKMKHPRTINEAFPKTMEYGAAIEIHVAQTSIGERWIRAIALLGLIVVLLDVLVWRP